MIQYNDPMQWSDTNDVIQCIALIQYNDLGCRGEIGSLCEWVEGEILFWQRGDTGIKYKWKMHEDC